jgi:predicted transcriptional regulator
MENASYDFTESNKIAHRNLVSTLVHHTTYFDEMTSRVNPELFSVACLEATLTYDRAYPVFKNFVKKAIDEYPAIVSNSKEMRDDLVHGFIIPPILELLASSFCTFGGKNVFEVVQAKIDEIGHDPKGYINKIEIYKSFLNKHGR